MRVRRPSYGSVAAFALLFGVTLLLGTYGGGASAYAQVAAGDTLMSRSARFTYHPATRIPSKILNLNMVPSPLKDGKTKLSEKTADDVFRAFLVEHIRVLRVDPKDLKLISARKWRDRWHIKYQQYYRDLPVYQATVGFTANAEGMITVYGSSYYPGIAIDLTPKIGLKEAAAIARRTYDKGIGDQLKESKSQKIIYPKKSDTKVAFHLAWKFLLSGARANPETDKYFIIDALNGAILQSYSAYVQASRAYGRVLGEIYPVNPTSPAVATEPLQLSYVTASKYFWDKRATTDANGDWSVKWPWYLWFASGYRATSELKGPHVWVRNVDLTRYTRSQPCRKNVSCDITWTDTDRDHINVFYHTNLLHEWYKNRLGHEWTNAWNGSTCFDATVNHSFFNAYAGDTLLFGTDDFARSSDVIYHECTHNVLYSIFAGWIGWPDAFDERYAFDEGFADYFAGAMTEDPIHGEGYGGSRTLDNTTPYAGKAAYNTEGHTGGTIIAGAAWTLRESLIDRHGSDAGGAEADNLIFDALQTMSDLPRDYYFSDPQESNFLTSLYVADDDNDDTADLPPHFHDIQQAFFDHGLLQATLADRNSFDVSSNTVGDVTGGDFYCSGGTFWANNAGQRGVIDLGDIGATALDLVEIPAAGYTRFGVAAALNHTYVSLAQEGEEGSYVVFRVTSLNAATNEVVISYLYRTPLLIDFNHFCLEHPLLCGHLKLPCAKYPQLCERQIVIPVEDGIRIKFFGEEKRVVVPVDGICRYVLNCPGCEFSALCPGYNISFTDMPQPFGVEIYTASGVLVASDMTGSTAKAIEFEANRGEELFLVLSPTRETKAGVEYSVHLKVRPIGR